jgi:hypothetical protein
LIESWKNDFSAQISTRVALAYVNTAKHLLSPQLNLQEKKRGQGEFAVRGEGCYCSQGLCKCRVQELQVWRSGLRQGLMAAGSRVKELRQGSNPLGLLPVAPATNISFHSSICKDRNGGTNSAFVTIV